MSRLRFTFSQILEKVIWVERWLRLKGLLSWIWISLLNMWPSSSFFLFLRRRRGNMMVIILFFLIFNILLIEMFQKIILLSLGLVPWFLLCRKLFANTYLLSLIMVFFLNVCLFNPLVVLLCRVICLWQRLLCYLFLLRLLSIFDLWYFSCVLLQLCGLLVWKIVHQ